MIACKPRGITAVNLFDIYTDDKIRIISYRLSGGILRVNISDDFMSAIMTNEKEFYMI